MKQLISIILLSSEKFDFVVTILFSYIHGGTLNIASNFGVCIAAELKNLMTSDTIIEFLFYKKEFY